MQPNSTLNILKGVDIEKGYNHTRRFRTATEQYKFFTNTLDTPSGHQGPMNSGVTVKYALTDLSYQRMTKNVIRVGILCDNLYDCNYIMFRNKVTVNDQNVYSNKWFYAFIDSVEYINDHCTEIVYTIDVIQSYMFDITVKQCFVEREHSVTDKVGDNVINEDFQFSEYYTTKKMFELQEADEKYYAGIVTNVQISKLKFKANHSVFCNLTEVRSEPARTGVYTLSGIPSTLYCYTGFSVNTETPSSLYYQQTEIGTSTSRTMDIGSLLQGISLNTIEYEDMHGVTNDLTVENIVTVYLYPKKLSYITYANAGYTCGITKIPCYIDQSNMPEFFMAKRESTNDNPDYYFSNVKNKKLLTSPYIKFRIYDFNGNYSDFNFENFRQAIKTPDGIKIPSITVYGNRVAMFSVQYLLENYLSDLTSTNFPHKMESSYQITPFYSGNALAEYMQTHRNSFNFGVISSVISGLTGVGIGVATAGLTGGTGVYGAGTAVRGGMSVVDGIGNAVSKVADLKNTPPSSVFSANEMFFGVNDNTIGGKIYAIGICAENAKIVDDFFSMYGYAAKEVKVPNIFKYWNEQYDDQTPANNHIRRYWNYIKTNGAIIHPVTGNDHGLNSKIEEQISEILDKGITYWNIEYDDNDTAIPIGDYSQNNNASIR